MGVALVYVCMCAQVFMREKQKQALQVELGEKVLARIIKIQRWVRAKLFKCRFLHMRRSAVTIQVGGCGSGQVGVVS